MKIYFSERKDTFGKTDGMFCLEFLKKAPFPKNLIQLGSDGIRGGLTGAKLRGRDYAKAESILDYAKKSVWIKDGSDASRHMVKWFANKIQELDIQIENIQ